jgi:hypothetical protein
MDTILRDDVSESIACNARERDMVRLHNSLVGQVRARAGAAPVWRAFHRGSPAMGALVIHGREVVRHYDQHEAMQEWLRSA